MCVRLGGMVGMMGLGVYVIRRYGGIRVCVRLWGMMGSGCVWD